MPRRSTMRRLDVRLNGRLAGYYDYTSAGGVSFTYAEDWLSWENGFAISRQLPLRDGTFRGEGASAVFENLLPDNDALRRIIAEKTEARSAAPHDLLSAIGRDCVGALQFLQHDADPGNPFEIEGVTQSEAEIAQTLRSLTFSPLGIEKGAPFRISLAGAQEKTAYLKGEDGIWLRPEGLTPTTHIFKRPMGRVHENLDMSESVENEFVCLALAREMGLSTNFAAIETFEDQKALVIERFDRQRRSKGGYLRLPQEDFLQAMGLMSGQKYEQHGGPSAVRCYGLLAGSTARSQDLKTFVKSQIFFWMTAAIDGHAKNFSIFTLRDGFRMTPLYDIMSAAPDGLRRSFRHKDLQIAMAAGRRRHYRLDKLHPRHFVETAKAAKVPDALLWEAVEELAIEGRGAADRVAADLPVDFPAQIADPILDYARRKHATLEDFAGFGVI